MKKLDSFYGNVTTGSGRRIRNRNKNFNKKNKTQIILDYKNSIKKDLINLKILNRININSEKFNIMDVGSGRQAIAFSKLTRGNVFHYDVSKIHIKETKNYIKKNKIKNIVSKEINLEKKNTKINFFDLVYLQGIIQHFKNPDLALKKIFSSIKTGGYAWLYFYKSGSYLNFLHYLLRILFHDKNNSIVLKNNYFSIINNFKKRIETKDLYLFDIFVDAIFTPYSHDFNPKKVIKAFKNSNFEIIETKSCDTGPNNYDHSCKYSAFIISIRKNFREDKVNYKLLSKKSSINQLKLKYKERELKLLIDNFYKLKKIFRNKYDFETKISICFNIFKKSFLENVTKNQLNKKYTILNNEIRKLLNEN